MFVEQPSKVTQGAPTKPLSSSDDLTKLWLNLPSISLLSVDLEPLRKFVMFLGLLAK